jgi:transcriptional regulator of acetoin/glycerol metabolism
MGYIAKKATRKTQRFNALEMGAAIPKVAIGASLLSFDPSAFTPTFLPLPCAPKM